RQDKDFGCVIGRRRMTYTAFSLWPCQNPYLDVYSGNGVLGFKLRILAAGIGRRRMTYTAFSLWPCQNPYLDAYRTAAGSGFPATFPEAVFASAVP
ncbi:MAG: hypothetical protein WAK95_04080, partial [Desulfobacterales bacterium]